MYEKLERVLYGAGGHARVVWDLATALQQPFGLIIDDDSAREGFFGHPVVSAQEIEWGEIGPFQFIVGIGMNQVRREKFLSLREEGGDPLKLIHPAAVVSEFVEIGKGSVLNALAAVNAGSRLGENVIINTSASVDHDCTINDHVHICPGVRISGTVTVGEGAFIGVGSSVVNNVRIGAWSFIGAGSVVTSDIPARVKAFGCPARIVDTF